MVDMHETAMRALWMRPESGHVEVCVSGFGGGSVPSM